MEQKFDGNFISGEEYEMRDGDRATYLGINKYASSEFDKHCWVCEEGRFTTNKNGIHCRTITHPDYNSLRHHASH